MSDTELQTLLDTVRVMISKRADNYLDHGDWEALTAAFNALTGENLDWRTADEQEVGFAGHGEDAHA